MLVYLIIVKVVKVKLLTLNKVASNGKDIKVFIKNTPNCWCGEWWMIIGKWKNDVNCGPKWNQ